MKKQEIPFKIDDNLTTVPGWKLITQIKIEQILPKLILRIKSMSQLLTLMDLDQRVG